MSQIVLARQTIGNIKQSSNTSYIKNRDKICTVKTCRLLYTKAYKMTKYKKEKKNTYKKL